MEILSKINSNIYMVGPRQYITREAYELKNFNHILNINLLIPGLNEEEMSNLKAHLDEYEKKEEM